MSDNIFLTDDSILNALLIKNENKLGPELILRLYLDGKGCDGFFYGVTFDTPNEEDLTFSCVHTEDPTKTISICVDPQTYLFTKGSLIKWVDDEGGIGKGFLVENPRHKKFKGKFYKRASWQERL